MFKRLDLDTKVFKLKNYISKHNLVKNDFLVSFRQNNSIYSKICEDLKLLNNLKNRLYIHNIINRNEILFKNNSEVNNSMYEAETLGSDNSTIINSFDFN